MQLSTDSKNINLRIAPQVQETLNPDTEPKHKKILRKVLSLLLLLFFIFSVFRLGSYFVFDQNGIQQIKDFESFVQSKIDPGSVQDPSKDLVQERGFRTSSLSYFNDAEIAKLGILSLPENFEVQETYKGIRFVKSPKQSFSPIQLSLLKRFVDMTPQKLLDPGPTAIVTYEKGEVKRADSNPNTSAFASGTYVFFNDQSFNPNLPLADSSVDAAYNTFLHELTHVSQFNEVTKDLTSKSIDDSYSLGLSWIDLVLRSELVKEYAGKNGWEQTQIDGKLDYTLTDKANIKTSDYGKTKVYEDMAEVVAGVASTNIAEFSVERQNWAYTYLGEDAIKLEKGKFPYSPDFEQVNASNLDYDQSFEAALKANHSYTDKQVFDTQKLNSLNTLVSYFEKEMRERGWQGSFTRTADKNNVVHYKGLFTGDSRDIYLELYSYDAAHGFSSKPKGTIIVAVNGYLKQ
jgi:hypothetical protein